MRDFDKCRYQIGFIDYIWYVAEKWSEKEHNNLNGGALLFLCWLFVILIPVVIPLAFRYLGWAIALAVVIPICFLPSLFCKLRYTAGRRETLCEHYRDMKRPGRRLITIILVAFALTITDFILMFHLGFIHWSK